MSNKKSFEKSMQELQKIIDFLESGESTLDNSVNSYKKAIDLISNCEKILKDAKLEIETYKPENSDDIAIGECGE